MKKIALIMLLTAALVSTVSCSKAKPDGDRKAPNTDTDNTVTDTMPTDDDNLPSVGEEELHKDCPMLPYDNTMSADGMFEYVPTSGIVTAYYGGQYVEIPGEIEGTEIHDVGVRFCYDLDILSVTIAEGIKNIGESAFEGSNVIDVGFPKSIGYIGDRAFANCSELLSMTFYGDDIFFGDDVFPSENEMNIFVPCILDTDVLREKLIAAKGADNFNFVTMHTNFAECTEHFNPVGNPEMKCLACGVCGADIDEVWG